ncbi:unnamed protein product [Closterium sp. NIES-54]
MYLMTCTRPDLAYPLSLLARYVAPGRHRKVHWDAAKRVLRYLCSTSGMGLVLGGRARVVLTGHADASWVDDLATQRSSQGYTFSLGSGSVSWRSTRSSSVLSSSCEAEIYAGAMAAQELRWLTYLLTDLGEAPRSPPVPYVDNKAMLAMCQEHRLEHRTKHIALHYFLARELQQHGQLRLAYVASQANTADVFTKALQPSSGRSVDDATAGKSASGRLPSLFSKSRRRDDQGDSTDNGDDKGVESSPREATGIHCLPTGGVRGFKSTQSSASPAGAAAATTASPTRGEAPAAEEATTPVGPKLIRSKGKIEIMGFEVANVIVRAINLRQSLLERDIEDLRAEVLASEGIRMLVSDDFYHVWCIAAEDKRGELRAVARDVARLGKQCLDPALHSLTQAFDALGTMDGPKGRMTSVEVEGELRALEGQAQITAELYHELANLEQLQQSLDRRVKQDSDSAVNRELIAQMRAEMKAQEKIVKTMKKKGLWSKTMDEVVEELVQVVIFLHDQIVDVFGADVVKVGRLMSGTPPTAADLRKLGVNGMALQYANIVNMIDTMVMRPACVETQREALFSALPASVCGRLKRTLLQSQDIEQVGGVGCSAVPCGVVWYPWVTMLSLLCLLLSVAG